MKRTIKLSIWGALIVIANQLNAASFDSSFNVSMVGAKAFELSLKNLKGDVKISLLNSKRGVIYNENFSLTDDSFKKIFDLGLFPDGNYTIELLDEEKSQSIPLSIEQNTLSVIEAERTVHFLPMVYKKDKLVRVNMPAFSKDYLHISIVDERDLVVFDKKIKGQGNNIGKVFDFSETNKGAYRFLLSSNAGLVSKEIQID